MVGYNPSFKVRGTDYVVVDTLLPGGVNIPKFSKIYVFDADDDNQRVNVRMEIFVGSRYSCKRKRSVKKFIYRNWREDKNMKCTREKVHYGKI